MKNRKGFTLAELLIVVAIIAVLVAIGIPIFTSQLEKTRIAVDQANVRSAKAAAAAEYLSEGVSGEKTYYYDGGKLVDESEVSSIKGYGKSSVENDDGSTTGAIGNAKDAYVSVTISEDGSIIAKWNDGSSSGGSGSDSSVDDGYAKPSGTGAASITTTDKFKRTAKYSYASWGSLGGTKVANGERGFSSGESVVEDDKLYVYIEPGYNGNSRSKAVAVSGATNMAEYVADSKLSDKFAIIDASTYTFSIALNSEDATTKYHKQSVALVGSDYYIAVAEGATEAEIDDTTKWVKIR